MDMDAHLERITWRRGEIIPSQCAYCIHAQDGAVCAAYPNGIPDGILLNKIDHRLPYDGDHGVQFEPYSDLDPELLGFLTAKLDKLSK